VGRKRDVGVLKDRRSLSRQALFAWGKEGRSASGAGGFADGLRRDARSVRNGKSEGKPKEVLRQALKRDPRDERDKLKLSLEHQ